MSKLDDARAIINECDKEMIALFKKRMQAVFTNVHKFKPDASRDESKETYYIGLKKKRNVDKLDVFSNS